MFSLPHLLWFQQTDSNISSEECSLYYEWKVKMFSHNDMAWIWKTYYSKSSRKKKKNFRNAKILNKNISCYFEVIHSNWVRKICVELWFTEQISLRVFENPLRTVKRPKTIFIFKSKITALISEITKNHWKNVIWEWSIP